MKVLGINAVFHDPAAALVVDGEIVAAVEEERFNRRKHGHDNVPFAAWEVPAQAARWCLDTAGIRPEDLDAVAYSYDPSLCPPLDEARVEDLFTSEWEPLRTLYAMRAPLFLRTALPGLDPSRRTEDRGGSASSATSCARRATAGSSSSRSSGAPT
jgi:carbamoyltransferase